MKLYFDGAAKNNGKGPAGAGWVLFDNNENILLKGHKYIGIATNNTAEYRSLIEGLSATLAEFGQDIPIDVYGDSKLVIEQVNKNWKVNSPHLKILWKDASELAELFKVIKFHWIRRNLNSVADSLANEAVSEHI
jgi:ribonuclease HI